MDRTGKDLRGEVIIIGGGVGGCAAALSAARSGRRVIMTEETDWIGGQLTAQAVPPDENPWIETYGGTKAYQDFRGRVREYYRKHYPLTPEARARESLNPGNGGVSRLCHEPRVALAVLQELLAPYVENGQLIILLCHKVVAADTNGDRVTAVKVRDLDRGHDRVLEGPHFLDATELGDVLPLAGIEYVSGAESRALTGEPHAAPGPEPLNMQAFTWCFAMDYLDGEDHTIDRPRDYAVWKSYVPQLAPPWPGPLFSWNATHPVTLQPRTSSFDPLNEDKKSAGLWIYRRILDKRNFAAGTYPSDICLVNWPQNDYWLGPLCEVPEAEARRHLDGGRQLSLSWLYWLQTEAPRPDGKTGWPGLRLRKDVVDTEDGLAKHPYIRESRRIKAEFTVTELHVGKAARKSAAGNSGQEIEAEPFSDSVGIGYYRIDLHPSCGGNNYIDIDSLPFQIPLGALIPRRVEGLLAACKNIGVTHVTNGCYRLHPVEWNVGEAAGTLAAFCLERKTAPRQVRNTPHLLEDLQRLLMAQGVPLAWPEGTRA
jgi:hypothetical protein